MCCEQVTESEPIDVAAHLKLLGESLATIGARLQEHKVSATPNISIDPQKALRF